MKKRCSDDEARKAYRLSMLRRMNEKKREFILRLESLEYVDKDGCRVLPALLREDCPGWKVWCRYCMTFHVHGVGLGGRTPHCSPIIWGRREIPGMDESDYVLGDLCKLIELRKEKQAQGFIPGPADGRVRDEA